jgi:predicted metal-binding membrane protein
MALLFVGGVMNVLWIAAIAIVVLAEKLLPGGPWLARLAGMAAVIAGAWMLTG